MNKYNLKELKSKNDILKIAKELNFNGTRTSGSTYQGDCPKHGSNSGTCFTVDSSSRQRFKCFHCGKYGDVIALVKFYKNYDFVQAVNYLADKVGMPHLEYKNLTPEEIKLREEDQKEKALIEDIFTEAAKWYHSQLEEYPEIKDYLHNHYGFSKEIIEKRLIGYAPEIIREDAGSELEQHLSNILDLSNLDLSGLFIHGMGTHDFFKNRIIIPFWNRYGKVAYLTGRATSDTPVNKYECYTDKNGNIKYDEYDSPMSIKYKKLRIGKPENNISNFIQNDTFMGEDTICSAKNIIITEGAPDYISAEDHFLKDNSFGILSPVTVGFREKDAEKLIDLTRNANNIYIINDNEKNNAGLKGAMRTGIALTKAGKMVYIVKLPKPEGEDKIDLNEYLKDHSKDDLLTIMNETKPLLEELIDELPKNFIKSLPAVQDDIIPILIEMEEAYRDFYVDNLKRKFSTSAKNTIEKEIKKAVEGKSKILKEEENNKEKEIDPKIQEEADKIADNIAHDPLLLKRRIDIVNKIGVSGERILIAMYFASLDSRLLPDDPTDPNTLSVKTSGTSGSGKSFVLKNCLNIYPESEYLFYTSATNKCFYYLGNKLKHRTLIMAEAVSFESKNGNDSELAYICRSIISEGRINRLITVKNKDTDNYEAMEQKTEGPTSLITTTIEQKLESQLEDRIFTGHTDESEEQRKAISIMRGKKYAGTILKLDQKTMLGWKKFHKNLKPVEVIIPFAEKIGNYLGNCSSSLSGATNRAFNRVMITIMSISCTYQHQRKRDESNRIIAEICDYWMSLQIANDLFNKSIGKKVETIDGKLLKLQEIGRPVTSKYLIDEWNINPGTISTWIKSNVEKGAIVWCDADGNKFVDEYTLKKTKHTGKAYIKVSDTYNINKNNSLLPTPFELTNDPKWDAGGELFNKYDLKLKRKSSAVDLSAISNTTNSETTSTLDARYCYTSDATNIEPPVNNNTDFYEEETGSSSDFHNNKNSGLWADEEEFSNYMTSNKEEEEDDEDDMRI